MLNFIFLLLVLPNVIIFPFLITKKIVNFLIYSSKRAFIIQYFFPLLFLQLQSLLIYKERQNSFQLLNLF